MLHHLHPKKFPKKFAMRVKTISERPKQVGTNDCGVYVCKYIDALLNAIPLNEAAWDPIYDVRTFRLRIAWELLNGEARHMIESGVQLRQLGH